MSLITNATGSANSSVSDPREEVFIAEAPLWEEQGVTIEKTKTTVFENMFPSARRAAMTTDQVAASFAGIEPEIHLVLGEYKKSASAITEAAGHFSSLIDNIKSMLEGMPLVKPFLCKILDALTIAYDIVMAFLNKCFYTVPTLIVRLFQLFNVDTMLINSFVKNIINFSVSSETVAGPENFEVHAGGLVDMTTEILGTLIIGHKPDEKQMKYVNEAMRFKTGFITTAKEMYSVVLGIVRNLPDQLQLWLSYVIPTKWWLDIFAPGSVYYTWIDEVNGLDEHEYTIRSAYDHLIQEKITRLYKTGQRLLKECTDHGTRVPQVYRLLESTFKKIDTLYKIVDMSAMSRTSRKVPFVIYLMGETGQGKSFISTILPAILAGCPHDTPNLSFSRNAAIPHWDGYTGQYAVQYDDFGAMSSANVSPGEVAEIVNIVSNEQMRLPMASLEDKGEVFRSKVVIISSNMGYLRPNDMNDYNALWRRRHAFYEVVVKQEFRKPGKPEVDPDRIPDDYSHWDFFERDPMSSQAGRLVRLDYRNFINIIRQKYHAHFAQQERASANYEHMIEVANTPPIFEVHGLREDFEIFMNKDRVYGDSTRSKDVNEFYAKLQKIDDELEKPKWVKALQSILPIFGVVATTMLLGYTAYKAAKNVAKAGKFLHKKYKEKKATTEAEKAKIAEVAQMLSTERVLKMDKEGRWRALYEDIKGASPWMIDLWDEQMDQYEGFANLTDEEVEAVIDKTLREPHVRKIMEKEGIYAGHHHGSHKNGNLRKPHVVLPKFIKEGCIDENAMQITTNKLASQICSLRCGPIGVTGCMVTGRIILVPYHVFLDLDGEITEEGTHIEVRTGFTTFRMSFAKYKMVRIGKDVALYELDATVPNFKDMLKYFMTNEDLNMRTSFQALIVSVLPNGRLMVRSPESEVTGNTKTIEYTLNTAEERKHFDGTYSDDIPINDKSDKIISYREFTAWMYEMQSYKGMCGSLIVRLDKFAARKLVGIHVSGTRTGTSLGHVVTQEMIKDGLKQFGIQIEPADTSYDLEPEYARFQVHGNYTPIGALRKPIYINEKSKIVPSITHGLIYPIKTLPAVMGKNDIRAFKAHSSSPLKTGVEKYGQIAAVVDIGALEEVGLHISNTFAAMPRGRSSILSEYESINGVEDDEFITKIDMTTSCGFPWNQRVEAKGKYPYIQLVDGKYAIVDETLRAKVDKRWKEALLGRRVESVWLDTLKDERRPLEKTFTGKVRVFTIPPVDFTIVTRRLFSSFTSLFYRNKNKYFSAVGIDPMSLDWTILHQKLVNKSSRGYSCDFSGWDGNLNPNFLMEICEIINRWYDDDEQYQRARRVIFDEIIHTVQCAYDYIYMTHCGNPSGNPLTVNINTIYHAMLTRYIYLLTAPVEMRCLGTFEENVGDRVYGDDGVNAIKDTILEFYNPVVIAQEVEKLNMTCTSASKDGLPTMENIDDLTFLKRGFRLDSMGFVKPIIAMDTITELTNWTRECADITVEQASIENLNDSLGFMYAYGKDEFTKHMDKIKEHLPKRLWLHLRGWKYYHMLFLSKATDLKFEKHADVQVDSAAPLATAGDETLQSDNKSGTIVEVQKKVEISGSTLEPKVAHILQMACIGEPEWTFRHAVQRKVWVGTYAWTTAMGVGTPLFALNLPQDAIVNYLQSMSFERFYSWRGSIKFTAMLTGMRQQLGRVQLFSVPFTKGFILNNWHNGNQATYYGLNSQPLDPSSATTAVYVVPYSNPKTYISINGPSEDVWQDFIGTLTCLVQVPLQTPTGVPASIDLALYVEFGEDSEFKVPINSGATGLSYNKEHLKQVQRRMMKMEKHGGQISNMTNITSYGDMDGTTVPQHLTNDDFQGAASGNSASIPAFDRAGRTWNPVNIVRKYIQNYTNSNGSELVTRLDLNPSNMHVATNEHFTTHVDEMAMSFLLHNPTVSHTFIWLGSALEGTSLFSGFIGPMFELFQPGLQDQITLTPGIRVPMTQWSYNAMHHAYYKGGMKVRLEIVATAFHVGSLTIAANYGAPPGVAVGLRDATSQYYKTFYLNNEKNVFDFVLPWVSQRPWLKMCRGPQSDDDVSASSSWWESYFTGSFDITINTALRTLQAAPPDVTVIMSVSGANDFVVYYPSNINQTFIGSVVLDTLIPLKWEKHAGAGDDATRAPPETPLALGEIIQPEGSMATIIGDHFGKRAAIPSVKTEIRRYLRVNRFDDIYTYQLPALTTASDGQRGFVPIFNEAAPLANSPKPFILYSAVMVTPWDLGGYNLATNQYAPRDYVTPLAHYGIQYRYMSGGMRFKVIFGDIIGADGTRYPQGQCAVTYVPHATFPDGGVATRPNLAYLAKNYGAPTFNTERGDVAPAVTNLAGAVFPSDTARTVGNINYCEVEVPYTSVYNVLATHQGLVNAEISPDFLNYGILFVTQKFYLPTALTYATQNLRCETAIMQSVADDFRFGNFLGVPNVFALDYTSPTAWPDTWVITPAEPIIEIRQVDSEEDFDTLQAETMTKSTLVQKLQRARALAKYEKQATPIDHMDDNATDEVKEDSLPDVIIVQEEEDQIVPQVVIKMEKHGMWQSRVPMGQPFAMKVPDFWDWYSPQALPLSAPYPVHNIKVTESLTHEQKELADEIIVYMRSRREHSMHAQLQHLRQHYGLKIRTEFNIQTTSEAGVTAPVQYYFSLQVDLPRLKLSRNFAYSGQEINAGDWNTNLQRIREELYTELYALIMVRSAHFGHVVDDMNLVMPRIPSLELINGVGVNGMSTIVAGNDTAGYYIHGRLHTGNDKHEKHGDNKEDHRQYMKELDQHFQESSKNIADSWADLRDQVAAALEESNFKFRLMDPGKPLDPPPEDKSKWEKHGDTIVEEARLTPTNINMVAAILSVYARYESQSYFNARMALHELSQKIDSIVITKDISGFDPFTAEIRFQSDNAEYTDIVEHASGARKRDAEERASFEVLLELRQKTKCAMASPKVLPLQQQYEPFQILPKKPKVTRLLEEDHYRVSMPGVDIEDLLVMKRVVEETEPGFFLRNYFSINEKLRSFGFRLTITSQTHTMFSCGMTKLLYRFTRDDGRRTIFHEHYGVAASNQHIADNKLELLEASFRSALILFLNEYSFQAFAIYELDDMMGTD